MRLTATTTISNNDVAFGEAPGLTDMYVTDIKWSGQWDIARINGANTEVILNLDGNGSWDLDQIQMTLTEFASSNISCTLTGTGTLLLRIGKN